MKLREDEMGESVDQGERAGLRTEPWSKEAKQPMKGSETIQGGRCYAGHRVSGEEGVSNRDPHCRDTKEQGLWGLLRELFWWRGVGADRPSLGTSGHAGTQRHSTSLPLQRLLKAITPVPALPKESAEASMETAPQFQFTFCPEPFPRPLTGVFPSSSQ